MANNTVTKSIELIADMTQPPPLTNVSVLGKSEGLVDGDMSAITSATTKVPGRTTADIEQIVTELCSICPQTDCIKIISEGSGAQIPRQQITKNLIIEKDKNYFKMWFPNIDDKVNIIGPHFLLGKRKRQKMLEEYNTTPEDEKPRKYNYELYEKVKSLAETCGNRYTFHNRNYLKKKNPSGVEANSPKNVTELFKIKLICDAATVAKFATPEPIDVLEQMIRMQELKKSLYKSSVDYVKCIAASHLRRCYRCTTSTIISSAFYGGYDEIRKAIRTNFFLNQLLKKCTELVKDFVKLDVVFAHLFEQAMKWRLLKIEGNDALLTESRTQQGNFYADILREATDNVYGTARDAVTSFEKRLRKKSACNTIIKAVPYHDSRSVTIVSTPSSHTQQSGETAGSSNVSEAKATFYVGRMESTASVTMDDGDNNGVRLVDEETEGAIETLGTSADECPNTETLSEHMKNAYEKQNQYYPKGNAKVSATTTTVAPTLPQTKTKKKELTTIGDAYSADEEKRPNGNAKVPATTTMVALTVPQTKTKKKELTTIGDAYSADEQQRIDDSFNATFRFCTENRSEICNPSYSKEHYYKRVWNNDTTNKKAYWGTVMCGYDDAHQNCRWTIHFDDNTTSTWDSLELTEGRRVYEKKKKRSVKMPSGATGVASQCGGFGDLPIRNRGEGNR